MVWQLFLEEKEEREGKVRGMEGREERDRGSERGRRERGKEESERDGGKGRDTGEVRVKRLFFNTAQ